MRILKFFFISLIIFLILGGSTAFIAREVLLFSGAAKLQSSLSQLLFLSKNGTQYIRACREKGTPATVPAIEKLQLRFLNSHEYVLEAICTQFAFDPIIITQEQLPLFVQKKPGSSGIIWGNERSGVSIEVFGRSRSVYVEKFEAHQLNADTALGVTPESTCMGYGYMCCQNETVSGIGQPYSLVNDCPKTCYAQCVPRPVVLSFVSDPFPDSKNRSVTIHSGESVSFSYVASFPNEKDPYTVTINFGDGENQTYTTVTGDAAHVYTCTTAQCTYAANIMIQGKNGVTAAETPITRLTITVLR